MFGMLVGIFVSVIVGGFNFGWFGIDLGVYFGGVVYGS